MNFNNFFNIFFYKLKQKNSFFLQNSLFFNKIFNNFLLLTLLFFSVFSFAKCTQNNGNSNQNNAKKTPKILCTTGILADGIAQIVGEKAEVQALMEAGTDPHLYKATPNDLVKMREADAIIYNGLHLEGKMAEVLEKFAKQKPILSVGDGLNKKHLRLLDEKSKSYDPHIWFSVPLWEEGLTLALDFLNKKYPENKEIFTKNFENYKKELQNLHTNAKKELQKIPKNQRVLITAHDAFGYFGQEYEVEVRGLQGISTVSEFGLKDITDLVNFVIARKISAVFVESSISPKSLEAVIAGCKAKNHTLKLGGTLYSDALGAKNSGADTYINMFGHNLKTIVEGIKN